MTREKKQTNFALMVSFIALLLALTIGLLLLWINSAGLSDNSSEPKNNLNIKTTEPEEIKAVDSSLTEASESLDRDLDVNELDQEIDALL